MKPGLPLPYLQGATNNDPVEKKILDYYLLGCDNV